jgi:hypothetical protein
MTAPRSSMPQARSVARAVRVACGLCAAAALGGCGVSQGGLLHASGTPPSSSDLNLSVRPCPIQTVSLLTPAELPPHLTPEWSPSSLAGDIGPDYDTGGPVYPGSIGDANEYLQWTGFSAHPVQGVPAGGALYTTQPTQVFQLAEEIDDWGTVQNGERWMATQRQSNQFNTVADYGDGVERIPSVPPMGGDAFMYQIDDGAASNSTPHTGPYVGHIFTDLEVRVGVLMFALSIDSGPDANPAQIAVSIMRSLMAKERSVCG